MRIAVISDIHANATAFEAVIKDIRQTSVDQIICLGDITTLGPQPRTCLQMVQDLGCKCIMGNHDAFMVDPQLIHTYTDVPKILDLVAWARNELSPEDLDFINGFNTSLNIRPDESCDWLFCHGTPTSHMADLLSFTPPKDMDTILQGHGVELMACGHTHIQMMRQHKGVMIVNPGSIGLPFKEYVAGCRPEIMLHAEYAVIEKKNNQIDLSLKRIPYDQKTFQNTIDNCGGLIQKFYSMF